MREPSESGRAGGGSRPVGQDCHKGLGLGQVLAAAEVLINGHLQERLDRKANLQGQLGDVGTNVHNGAVAHDAKEPGGLLQVLIVLAGKCNGGVVKGDRGHWLPRARDPYGSITVR
jgi:hypothetical protein